MPSAPWQAPPIRTVGLRLRRRSPPAMLLRARRASRLRPGSNRLSSVRSLSSDDRVAPNEDGTFPLKRRSSEITGVEGTADWEKRAGARAFFWATGWKQDDFRKPIITVACPWTNATPCNNHFRELGDVVVAAWRRTLVTGGMYRPRA